MLITFPSNMDRQLRYYLSGPMSGLPKFNYDEFTRTAGMLRDSGFDIVSPHEIAPPTVALPSDQETWQWYMNKCKIDIQRCSAIIFLKGWPASRGARREFEWAVDLGFKFYFFEEPNNIVDMNR